MDPILLTSAFLSIMAGIRHTQQARLYTGSDADTSDHIVDILMHGLLLTENAGDDANQVVGQI